MSANIIQILLVEDSESDAVLLLAELARKGYSVTSRCVETREDYVNAIKSHGWDAVISDFVLPQFSGPEALNILRQQGLDTPFIMVSGVYGEEAAVGVMKAGANDYILKGNLSRLVPALERELEAALTRHLHKRAAVEMQYLAAIVESNEDAIYGMNLDSIVVSWNPAAERLFGYSAEEMIGCSIVTLFAQMRRDEMLDILSSIRRGDIVGLHETERRHQSGRLIPVSATISPIKNATGAIIGASCITRDITLQKQAEFERQKLIERLQTAAHQIKTLTGLLPICATCKRIRDNQGYWQQVEAYISGHSEIVFSHGICPECFKEYERQFNPRAD